MATVRQRLNNWALEEIRWASQVNEEVLVAWYNKWLQIFQKAILEYVSWQQNVANAYFPILEWVSEYELPLGVASAPDFYSIIQLRVAYDEKNWVPLYRVCTQINPSDYNISPVNWKQIWEPEIWKKISKCNPRFTFVDKNHIKIYPTPTKRVDNWLALSYNYIEQPVSATTNENSLNLPWYFFDAIEDYLTFRLYQAENPEMAQWYYQQFENTLHDNIYWLNKDKRPIEEDLANTSYFSHY
jgi:hypothetical protein